jgi:hypothetical protein
MALLSHASSFNHIRANNPQPGEAPLSHDSADGLRTPGSRNQNQGPPEYPLWNIPSEVAKVKGRWSSDASLTQLSLADLRGGATVITHQEGACTGLCYPNAQKSRFPPVTVERGLRRLIQGLPSIPRVKIRLKHRYYALFRRLRVGSLSRFARCVAGLLTSGNRSSLSSR